MEDGAERIVNNHGLADTLFAPPGVFTQYADQFLESKRVVFGQIQVGLAMVVQYHKQGLVLVSQSQGSKHNSDQ